MAFKLINRTFCPFTNAERCEFILDSAEDVADLPQCCAGSMALVADKDGAGYIVNASGEWKEM